MYYYRFACCDDFTLDFIFYVSISCHPILFAVRKNKKVYNCTLRIVHIFTLKEEASFHKLKGFLVHAHTYIPWGSFCFTFPFFIIISMLSLSIPAWLYYLQLRYVHCVYADMLYKSIKNWKKRINKQHKVNICNMIKSIHYHQKVSERLAFDQSRKAWNIMKNPIIYIITLPNHII